MLMLLPHEEAPLLPPPWAPPEAMLQPSAVARRYFGRPRESAAMQQHALQTQAIARGIVCVAVLLCVWLLYAWRRRAL